MLTRKERETLKEAGRLITRELLAGEPVGIHRFGKFYTTELDVAVGMHKPGEDVMPDKPTKRVHVVRFRAWECLKKQLHAIPTSDGEPEVTVVEPNPIIKLDAHVDLHAPVGSQVEDEPLPFCPHCGEDFGHLVTNPKTCPGCGLSPELCF